MATTIATEESTTMDTPPTPPPPHKQSISISPSSASHPPTPCPGEDLKFTDFDTHIMIRSVWSSNVDYEFSLIRNAIDDYPFVSMDTEFPGVVFRHHHHYSDPFDHYQTLKSNVDALKLIQVGITLTDSLGNLPNLGCPGYSFIWEFNFCDFDVTLDDHAPNSIDLLRHQGLDFEVTRDFGVSASRFAELMMSSGLVCNDEVTYITFHSGYDFGYLLKAITGKALPATLPEFLNLLRLIFGRFMYDVKHLMKFCRGLYGGLNRVAESLGVKRAVGQSHQAGSDSLITWHTFQKIKAVYFSNPDKEGDQMDKYAGVLFALEAPDDHLLVSRP